MLYTHFELDKALQAARDDAWEEGKTKDRTKGRVEGNLRAGRPRSQ